MVLGANYVNTDTVNDANEAPLGMTYVVFKSGTPMNVPDSNHVLIQTFAIGQTRKVQYAFATFKDDSQQGVFYRISNNDGTFTNVAWIRMYDPTILNDSTILSPLATALGVANVENIEAKIDDGYPINAWCFLATIYPHQSNLNISLQFLIVENSGTANSLWVRTKLSGQFKAWKSITLT